MEFSQDSRKINLYCYLTSLKNRKDYGATEDQEIISGGDEAPEV